MNELWQELSFEVGDGVQLARIALRLCLAAVMGSFIGLQREHAHESAGWRTHLIVTMAAAMFVMAVKEAGGSVADLTRVIQGVAVGVGFIGGGAIFKSPGDSHGSHIKGLTTAASIWLTSAVGIAVGIGRIWLPLVGSVMGWFILGYLKQLESHTKDQGST